MTSPQMSHGYLTGICTKETVKRTGLNVWATGCGDNGPDVDIIAVQGLGAHPYYTWVAKTTQSKPQKIYRWVVARGSPKNAQAARIGDVNLTASGATEVMWLRDFLPVLFPKARVATYSYESDWRKSSIKTSLRKCGEQLLNVLRQHRSSQMERQRPIIFVGHSLGGLVIKQALVLADHGHDFKDIRQSTAGIIFLGTPHQGSDATVYGLWLAEAMRHDKTLLQSLTKNSPQLYDVARDFEASHGDTDVICFFENKEASYGPWRTQFADTQSATLVGKRAMYLNTDHSGLNKFDKPEDENFLLVLPEIRRIVKAAPQIIEERYRAQVANDGSHSFHVEFSLRGIPVVERFVGRDEEMAWIAQALLPTSTSQMRRKVFIIHGLGGVGKTQLSVEYTRRHHKSYSAVFWIDSSTKERVRRSIADLASRLPQHQLSEKTRQYLKNTSSDIDETVKGVLNWFSQPSNDQWLLIFDNVDREYAVPSKSIDAFDVKDYFPSEDQGSILITSRLASLWKLGAKELKLRPVNQILGKTILENSSGRSEEDSSDLVARLQGLPLALNQAGSYMRMTNTNVIKYIELYEKEWSSLMEKQHAFASYEETDRSILTTWTLSFNSLRLQSDAAANLLMLCSFLDGQDIWYELFKPILDSSMVHGIPFKDIEVPPWLADCIRDELEFKQNMGRLLEYSFIDAKIESSSYSIHSVLHSWCFHLCKETTASMGPLALLIVVCAGYSEATHNGFTAMRRLLPHCDRICFTFPWLLREAVQNEKGLDSICFACDWLARLYLIHGKSEDAERMCLVVFSGFKELRAPDNMRMCFVANRLGEIYLEQRRMEEAEESLLRAIEGFQKHFGLDCELACNPLRRLGELYSKQGKGKEAEHMYLRSLTTSENSLGFEHSNTLDAVHSLGQFYEEQGRTEKAEDMYLRALDRLEKSSTPQHELHHELLLMVMSDLGSLYSNDECKTKDAEEMYLRALATYRKTTGHERIGTIGIRHDLGNLYSKDPCKMKEAEKLYLEALTGYEKIFGPEDLTVMKVKYELGKLYSEDLGKRKEAEKLLLGALAGYEKIHGSEHIDVGITKRGLGNLYSGDPGKIKEATNMLSEALTIFEKIYDAGHVSVISIKQYLGFLYMRDPCKIKEAENMFVSSLDGIQKIYGSEHEIVFTITIALGSIYDEQGRWKEAEAKYFSALDGSKNWSADVQVCKVRCALAILFQKRSMLEKAIQQFELALEGFTDLLGPDDEITISTLTILQACRRQLEAEKKMSNPVPEDRHSASESRRLSAP